MIKVLLLLCCLAAPARPGYVRMLRNFNVVLTSGLKISGIVGTRWKIAGYAGGQVLCYAPTYGSGTFRISRQDLVEVTMPQQPLERFVEGIYHMRRRGHFSRVRQARYVVHVSMLAEWDVISKTEKQSTLAELRDIWLAAWPKTRKVQRRVKAKGKVVMLDARGAPIGEATAKEVQLVQQTPKAK